MKVVGRGQMNAALGQILRQNVRVPDQVMGDLHAQFTGLSLIERQVIALMKMRGLATLDALSTELRGRSEAAMRKAIRALPGRKYGGRGDRRRRGGADPIAACADRRR